MPNLPVLPATLPFVLGLANELTYFQIIGYYGDIENPPGTDGTIQPSFGVVNGTVTFFPRVPQGTVLFIPDLDTGKGFALSTGVPLAPIQARIINGQLQTINRAQTPMVELLAFSNIISAAMSQQNLGTALIYDVQFSNVTYDLGAPQIISNFAFAAPTSNITVTLTDPALARLPYAGPNAPFILP